MLSKWLEFVATTANSVAALSSCNRGKVGAVVFDDKNIISIAYNGTPEGESNECEKDGITCPNVVHAEMNAIAKICRSTSSSKGLYLYVTLSPCIECSKMIIACGFSRVYYEQEYRDISGLEMLRRHNLEVVKTK